MSPFFSAQLSTFHGFYFTNNIDRLTSTIQHQILPFKQGSVKKFFFEHRLVFCPLLYPSKYIIGMMETARQLVASVSIQHPGANFIAMAGMMVPSA